MRLPGMRLPRVAAPTGCCSPRDAAPRPLRSAVPGLLNPAEGVVTALEVSAAAGDNEEASGYTVPCWARRRPPLNIWWGKSSVGVSTAAGFAVPTHGGSLVCGCGTYFPVQHFLGYL
ncbi:glutaredoxin-like protein C5orf63 homolog isoform X2 [Corvus moneduloides]|uniref:glutaredoxin-like protein C5orf63 homolog isoform X2 n=1 Tax=Corvus moneduloides TaxID=1196302 RepID=UPI0013621FC8|nr:glutaredoxin-like protein C5orf63 homolog isoform X2 [Corvus moneduloides]